MPRLHTTDVFQEDIEIALQAVEVVSGGVLTIET